MFKKSPLKSPKLVKQKRRRFLIKVGLLIAAFVALFALLSFLTKLYAFAVTHIEVTGNSAVDTEEIKNIIKNNISGNYLFLFSKSNRFLYPKNAIHSELIEKYKRIDTATLEVEGHTLKVSVKERLPSYAWCAGVPTDATKSCYFIDATGYVFSEAPVFSGDVFLSFYGLLDEKNAIGSTYIGGEEFKNLDKFITWLDAHTIKVRSVLAKPTGVYEVYVPSGAKIIFKASQAPSVLQSTIETIMLNTDILTNTSSSTLEYVDLRFGNKVYYKFIGDNDIHIEEEADV